MRVLLCGLNAKYIHSNLAVHYLKEYARFSFDKYSRGDESLEVEIKVKEYTINQQFNQILEDIYKGKPDLIGFSCYIWNISIIKQLVVELKKVLPNTKIWLGGPEVSYNSMELMKEYPEISGVITGEGEVAFARLLKGDSLEEISGIVYRNGEGYIKENLPLPKLDLDCLPFPYTDLVDFNHRIIYYESSRGCPFSCSYCLSQEESKVRFRNLEKVKKELEAFIKEDVAQVKFVDRTFNCNGERAREIWKFIRDNDNGKINFHFEIAGDLLREADLQLLKTLRPGLVQFEIGVQSTNQETLKEIDRDMDFSLVKDAVKGLKEYGNIHLHLDLIAGLPMEDIKSFAESFNDVYQLKPHQLQLGFLKLLKGSKMERKKGDYDLITQDFPPYEVMSTKWMDFSAILKLKSVEEMLENYYNSRQFHHSINWLEKEFLSPFHMYESLGEFYQEKGYDKYSHSREKRYEILLKFVKYILWQEPYVSVEEEKRVNIEKPLIEHKEHDGVMGDEPDDKLEEFRQLMTLDYYLRENPKKRPAFAGEESLSKEEIREFYIKESIELKYLKDYQGMDIRKIRKMTHLERINGKIYLFDYRRDGSMGDRAKAHIISI
jgi:radical SAM superfamily enzyme YgiQ (UPF0313 family)